jgi:hypothetical protein
MSNRTLRMVMEIALAVIMSLVIILPAISYAIMWVGPGGHVGKPTPPSHGGAPIYTPQVSSIGYGGGSGSGTSTFSPPGNTGGGYGGPPINTPMMSTAPTSGLTDGYVGHGVIVRGNPGAGQGSVTVYGSNGNGQLTVTTINTNNNGYTVTTTNYNSNGKPVSQTTLSVSKGQTVTNSTTVQTITKTYTQYIYDTYVVDHYIYEYMYPIIQWVFTLVNIGQYQAPGYHSVGSEKLFTPGFGGGSGIFVPVFAQEAVYVFNIAPSTKPQITGWYVGSTSQSSSGPRLVSQSFTPPQLSNIQSSMSVYTSNITLPNITKTTTYWNYITQPGSNNTVYVPVWQKPYYYSPQDITTAYQTSYNYWLQTLSDLLHGNIIGAAQSFGKALYYNNKGTYEQVYNFYAGTVSTLYKAVADPNYTWSIAHALSVNNIIDAVGTVISNVGQALGNGWNHSVGWALNQLVTWFSHL